MTSILLKLTFLVSLLSIFTGCEDENVLDPVCGSAASIAEDFDSRPSELFTISSVELDGKCLSITVGAGGCDGESWEAELLVSPLMTRSLPPQIGLRMILDDDELCEAFITKTFQFDLSTLDELDERFDSGY